VAAGRFLGGLPAFLRYRLSPDAARALLRSRLERRGATFLAMVGHAVYGRRDSPYRRLLVSAGCEFGDLERMVRQDGLEGTLRALLRAGVYLAPEELKGLRPIVRGGLTFTVDEESLLNPGARPHLLHYRSTSYDGRRVSAPIPLDFAHMRDRAVNLCLAMSARGGIGWQHAYWDVPGSLVLMYLVETLSFDRSAVRWFTPVDPAAAGLHPRYRWSARLMRWECAALGVALPRPQHVPLEDPGPLLDWIADTLRAGQVPHLKTYTSSAVQLSQAAQSVGLDLRGTQLTVTGEPATPARLLAIRRSGATAVQRCGSKEVGQIGYGCLAPTTPGDLHHFSDQHALVQPAPEGCPAGLGPRSLLFTSLRPAARLMLLNVSIGDQAELLDEDCGCALAAVGWRTRLRELRSHEKLTTGGMGLLDLSVIPVLEQTLPARFGGGPTDYQLVETDGEDGLPRLRLLVHPRVGAIDASAVADTFLDAIGTGAGAERVMALHWRRSLVVERRTPLTTALGKIPHLHRGSPREGSERLLD
jgi:hypothetical protein